MGCLESDGSIGFEFSLITLENQLTVKSNNFFSGFTVKKQHV